MEKRGTCTAGHHLTHNYHALTLWESGVLKEYGQCRPEDVPEREAGDEEDGHGVEVHELPRREGHERPHQLRVDHDDGVLREIHAAREVQHDLRHRGGGGAA